MEFLELVFGFWFPDSLLPRVARTFRWCSSGAEDVSPPSMEAVFMTVLE
jgi:hypothetical protein